MNKDILDNILAQHKLWVESARHRGSRADLYGADLYGANLSNIQGKTILTFQAGKDFAYACDGRIKIGCEDHAIKYWLSNFEEIGEDNNYTKDETRRYGDFIKYIDKELNNEKT